MAPFGWTMRDSLVLVATLLATIGACRILVP